MYEYNPDEELRYTDVNPGDSITFDVYYRYNKKSDEPLYIDVYTQASSETIAAKTIVTQDTNEIAETEQITEGKITDYVELHNTSLQIGDYEFAEDDEGYPAVKVNFVFTNNSDIPLASNLYTISGYQNGTLVYEYIPIDEEFIYEDVDPGKSISFYIYYRYSEMTDEPLYIDVYTQESSETIGEKTIITKE